MFGVFHLSKLTKGVRAFFRHDLALRRGEGGLRVVLEDPAAKRPAVRPPTKAEKAAARAEQDLQQARAELAQLLDQDAALRSKVRHLTFIEQALAKKGWRGLYKVPLDVLQRALDQLETLVTNWSPVGLACLRSKMAVAIIDREHQDEDAEADAYRTAAVLDNPPSLAAQAIEDARAATEEDEDAALKAAYAALGALAPDSGPETAAPVELHGELGSPSAKALARSAARPAVGADDIRLRDLQS
jgi:hypothetical protein